MTSPRPAPSSRRISPTAWYRCVELICTLVGVPISAGVDSRDPGRVRRHRRAVLGHLDESRRAHVGPQLAQTVGVGRGRRLRQHRDAELDQLTGRVRRHRPRHGDDDELGAVRGRSDGRDQLLDGAHRRHTPRPLDLGAPLRRPRHHADALEPLGHQPGHADEELRPPPAADHAEPDGCLRHRETVLAVECHEPSERNPAASALGAVHAQAQRDR